MSTPTAMKKAPSQQGKTPSQSQHGAAATPPVSTPAFYAAAFSPHGPRSSPQVKKSPATVGSVPATMNHPSNAPVNFDSPSAAAAFGSLPSLDLNLDSVNVGGLNLGPLGKSNEDERAKRLDEVVAILSQSKGVVSEAGLERLAKRLGIECIWEDESESKRLFIVAGSALELVITISKNVVQEVTLSFPDSAESVNKHAAKAARILFDDLKLAPNQIPLTKKIDKFAANFERLAVLDKMSINPGLNLFEAVCGVYESLEWLHRWEIQKMREDVILAGKSDAYIESVVLCTKSGRPIMNSRGEVGLSLDYWKEKRFQIPSDTANAADLLEKDKIWALLISCAPLRDISIAPVRVSDRWISPNVEKIHLPGELHNPGEILIDWLEPENTFIPHDQSKAPEEAGGIQADQQLLGQLPNVAFTATFDPPLHISSHLTEQFRHFGLSFPTPDIQVATLDSLIIPFAPGTHHPLGEPRTVLRTKKVAFKPPGETEFSLRTHRNSLHVYRSIFGKTLREASFSHPQILVQILPYLRQYSFLSILLENSFGDLPDLPPLPSSKADDGKATASVTTETTTKTILNTTIRTKTTTTTKTTTRLDELDAFMAEADKAAQREIGNHGVGGGNGLAAESPYDVQIDVTLSVNPIPQLQIVFPFRDRTADVVLEIRENGQVHVEAQDVLDASNAVAPDGRQRRVEDLGRMLEIFEDIGKWVEFLRTRWA